MTSDLATRAELVKLARVLDTSVEGLAFLRSADSADIHELREGISAALHDKHRDLYQRIASASKLLPAALCVQVAERTFPPVISAKVAAEIGTDRIGEFAKRLSVAYMADVCTDIDPRRVPELLASVPVERGTRVAVELVRRREYLTLGRMIDAATEQLVRAAAAEIESDEALLWVAVYVESVDRLTSAVRALPAQRIRSVLHTALSGATELHGTGLALIARVDDEDLRRTLTDYAAEESDETLERLVRTAVSDGFLSELLVVVANMNESSLQRFAALNVLTEREILVALARAVDDGEYRERLLPLVDFLPEHARDILEDAGFTIR